MKKLTNEVIEDHGDWLIVDISTQKHPNATMAVDADVWERREGGRVGAYKGTDSKYIRAQHTIGGGTKLFHHQVIAKVDGLEVDHKEHGTMTFIDNRKSNLRTVTHAQNMINRGIPSNNTSGTSGVYWQTAVGKWHSNIKIDGKSKFLGLFTDKSDAIAARKIAEEKHYGEYAFKSEHTKGATK